MVIRNVNSDRTGAANHPAAPATPVPPVRPAAPVARDDGDRVEISAEARALAAGTDAKGASLTPERVAALREWILSGGFDKADVIDAVARGILDSGDI